MSLSDRDFEVDQLRIVASDTGTAAVAEREYSDVSNVAPPPPRQAVLVRLSDVQPEPVTWLWESYIPRGKLTLLEGDPAAGKTWLALAIAAALSRGWGLPDPETGRPVTTRQASQQVIYLTGEDGLADTLRPRLDAVGADVSRVHAVVGARDGESESSITLRDLDVLDDALKRTRSVLLVVDPLQGFLGANVDMHRANEVRPVLTGLAKLAERYSCAVLCIRHLSKGNTDRALYRGLGSIDFTAAARSVLLAGRDPNDPNRRALVHIKNSLAAEGPALAYSIADGRFTWAGLSEMTAASLLARDASEDDRSALDEATEFLRAALADGPRPAKDVQRDARSAGIADATLRRARQGLSVDVRRTGGVGAAGHWTWAVSPNVLTRESEHFSEPDGDATAKKPDGARAFPDAAKLLIPKVLNDDEHLSSEDFEVLE